MSYKKGLSKTRFKQTMRMFWTERWRYQRTPEEWVESVHTDTGVWYSGPDRNVINAPFGRRASDLLFSAVDKLVLERKLLKASGENMKEMIVSPDRENALVAIQIMAALKPKKFKKVINIKNTETNE